jgi:hypothetical protein
MNNKIGHDTSGQSEIFSANLLISSLKKENLNLQKKAAKLEAKKISLEQQVIALKAENRKLIRENIALKSKHIDIVKNLSDEDIDLEIDKIINEY